MAQISVTGSIIGGPAAGGETAFPAAQFITPLRFSQNPKGFQSGTGILTRSFSDANVFVALSVGPGDDVPRATTLYIRSQSDYRLRITQDDGVGTLVKTVPLSGLCLMEFPIANAAVLIEVAASGTLEYFVSGP